MKEKRESAQSEAFVKVARKSKATKPMTPDEQQRRFIEAAREAGCSEDEAESDANLLRS